MHRATGIRTPATHLANAWWTSSLELFYYLFLSAAVLHTKALLKVWENAMGVCKVFQSKVDDFLSNFAKEEQKTDGPITG